MPRNQQSKSNTSAQLSVRCDADLKEQYQNALDDDGKSMSDDLRDHMQTVVKRHGGKTDDLLPEKPKLRKGLKVLADHAYPWGNGWVVKVSDAEGDIRNEANISGRVDRQVFRPLRNAGYLLRGSTAGVFEIDPRIVARLREDIEGVDSNGVAKGKCALCGESADAEDLTATSADHPAGPNLIACPTCANRNEVTAHGD